MNFSLVEYEWSHLILFLKITKLIIVLNYGVRRNDVDLCCESDWFWWNELLEVFLQVFEELFFPNVDNTLPKIFQNLCKNKNVQKF